MGGRCGGRGEPGNADLEIKGEALLGGAAYHRGQGGDVVIAPVGEVQGDSGHGDGVAVKLGLIDLPQVIVRGMDVRVVPVGESDGGNANGGVVGDHVVARIEIGDHLRPVRFTRAEARENRPGIWRRVVVLNGGEVGIVALNKTGDDVLHHVVEETPAGVRRAS